MLENKDFLLKKLEQLLAWKKSKSFYAKYLGITEEQVESLLQELRKQEPLNETWVVSDDEKEEEEAKLVKEEIKEDKLEIEGVWKNKPSSPDEIEKAHNIDKSKWLLYGYKSRWTGNKWLVSADFKRRKTEDLYTQKEILLDQIKQYYTESIDRPYHVFRAQIPTSQDLLLELSIFDPHFGKLAWAEETGDDYDIDIAEQRFKRAIFELIGRIDNIDRVKRIHLPIGNDLFNIDNSENTTTAGTPQDSDSRFGKIVKKVKCIIIDTIDELSTIAPVDVTIIPGNHDSHSSFMLGEILDAYYHNDSRININNSPKWRKFYQYGVNGFMYTHGDKEKQADLGIIFATEEPKLWSDTKYRFAKIGHFHSNKTISYISVEDKTGFQVQILPSLSGTDEWHYSKGYLSNKQAKAYLYHKTDGEIASYTYNA